MKRMHQRFSRCLPAVSFSLMAVMASFALSCSLALAADDPYPYHADKDKLVVTRGDKILRTLPCERIELSGGGRWSKPDGHENAYISTQIAKTSDGTLYVQGGGAYGEFWVIKTVRNVMFESKDQGRTWTSWNIDLPEDRVIGAFIVLKDDSFLCAATQPSDDRISYYRSLDRGKTWQLNSEIAAAPFQNVFVDGTLLQIQDGTILSPLHFRVKPAEGEHLSLNLGLQFVMRSKDGGKTWENGPNQSLWKLLIDAQLTVAPQGPESRVPGGTFPGCYETGLAQQPSGRLVAVLRFSGAPWPWHQRMREPWGGRDADNIGRIFRQVMFSTSEDGGLTWAMMKPFFDADGKPVIIQQETNGVLLPLSDDRIVLVHQRRFGPFQNIGRVSADGGKTWLHDEYRLSAGFGFPSTLLLDDGTIVTATGKSYGGKHAAEVIRWRLPSKQELVQ